MKDVMRAGKTIALLASCLAMWPAWGLDPDLSHYQYEFIYVPEDVDMPSDVTDIVQDQQGFLWLATSRGLARYDGLELSLYRVSNYPALQSNTPTRLFVDSNGRLFIASRSGLSIYENGEFRVLAAGTDWSKRIRVFTENNVGTVFVGGDDGLWQFREGEEALTALGSQFEDVFGLLWHDETLFVGARGRVHLISDGVEQTIMLPTDFGGSRVRDFAVYKDEVWAATRHGLLTIRDEAAVPFRPEMFNNVSFNRLLVDRDDNLWFVSRRNIGRIKPNGETELPDVADETFGYVPEFSDILEDTAGNVWLASSFFGLGGLRDTAVTRISYSEGLSSPNVTAIAADGSGAVYVATDQGIDRVEANQASPFVVADFSNGTSIRTMMTDDEQLWVGTTNGLQRYSRDSGEMLPSILGDDDDSVATITRGANESTWVATPASLYEFRDDKIEQRVDVQNLSINHLMSHQSGQQWLATDRGVGRLLDGKIELFGEGSTNLSQPFSSLAQLHSGEVVALSVDHGMSYYDGERWLHVRESDGLPAEQLIDVDVAGSDVWIVTGSGAFAVAGELSNVGENSKLDLQPVVATPSHRSAHHSNCCRGSGDSAAVFADGKFYVATDDGIIFFRSDIPRMSETLPRPYVKSVASNGNALAVSSNEAPRLDWQSNNLRVEYSAVQLTDGDQVEFQYRLLGLSNEWVNNGSSRYIQFQNLPVGDYTLEMRASLQPDVWSNTLSAFSFERVPRFIETKLFQVLVWTSIVLGTVLLTWLRMVSVRRHHKQLEAQIQDRTKLLGDLNDELKTANRVLQQSNQTDPLTGLTNRRFFDKVDKEQLLSGEIANGGVVMVIDIDFFKRVNDSYGHAAGDDVLCQFSSVLQSCVRQSDLVIRWGGEEFVIMCRCPNDDASAMLERVCEAVRQHAFTVPDGKRIEITCSIGAIRYPLWETVSPNKRMSILMELADAALYEVKMTGRDGWSLLESGSESYSNPRERYVGPRLGQLIEANHLQWTSSKAERPGPSLIDTQTRLRAIKSKR